MPELTRRTVREDDKGGNKGAGPLASLQQNEYKFSSFNYPLKIENLSHAMLFNINVQDGGIIGRGTRDLNSGREQLSEGEFQITQSRQQRVAKETRSLTSGIPVIGGTSIGLTRYTKRIKRAISLYVPETLVFDDSQEYKTPSLTKEFGLGGAALASVVSANPNLSAVASAGAIAGALLFPTAARAIIGGLSMLDRAQKEATQKASTAAAIMGFAINPVIEVLYSSPRLRKFRFDFVFAPTSKQEADMVWQIIYEFRRHAAPEILFGGTMFLPPSEFEITFLRKTMTESSTVASQIGGQIGGSGSAGSFVENTNMPRISTCVLTDITTDYSPQAFATFQDGMPVQIRMTLQFLEMDILTRESIDRGY